MNYCCTTEFVAVAEVSCIFFFIPDFVLRHSLTDYKLRLDIVVVQFLHADPPILFCGQHTTWVQQSLLYSLFN